VKGLCIFLGKGVCRLNRPKDGPGLAGMILLPAVWAMTSALRPGAGPSLLWGSSVTPVFLVGVPIALQACEKWHLPHSH